jgi:hypothetical protein
MVNTKSKSKWNSFDAQCDSDHSEHLNTDLDNIKIKNK